MTVFRPSTSPLLDTFQPPNDPKKVVNSNLNSIENKKSNISKEWWYLTIASVAAGVIFSYTRGYFSGLKNLWVSENSVANPWGYSSLATKNITNNLPFSTDFSKFLGCVLTELNQKMNLVDWKTYNSTCSGTIEEREKNPVCETPTTSYENWFTQFKELEYQQKLQEAINSCSEIANHSNGANPYKDIFEKMPVITNNQQSMADWAAASARYFLQQDDLESLESLQKNLQNLLDIFEIVRRLNPNFFDTAMGQNIYEDFIILALKHKKFEIVKNSIESLEVQPKVKSHYYELFVEKYLSDMKSSNFSYNVDWFIDVLETAIKIDLAIVKNKNSSEGMRLYRYIKYLRSGYSELIQALINREDFKNATNVLIKYWNILPVFVRRHYRREIQSTWKIETQSEEYVLISSLAKLNPDLAATAEERLKTPNLPDWQGELINALEQEDQASARSQPSLIFA